MAGITDLGVLLKSLAPELDDSDYVFVTVGTVAGTVGLEPVCVFRESEAVTAICTKAAAEAASLRFEGTYRKITLNVHSSLGAVGLLAAVSVALADAQIPCNAVSAYYHDHLFVPAQLAPRALEILKSAFSDK